jgi:two-component sensor histidine kinase
MIVMRTGARMIEEPSSSTLTSTIVGGPSRSPSVQKVPFERLLLQHCERIIANSCCQDLIVQLELHFEGTCPVSFEKTVLRVAEELLSNAMEHGFYMRERGHVFVHVVSRATVGVQVCVSDDGWGFDGGPIIDGNGFQLLRQIGDLRFSAATAPSIAKTEITVVIPLLLAGRY